MNCHWVSSLLSAYIDGELTGVQMLEIRRHLDCCRACSLQYESLRYVKQLLAHLSYAQPRAGLAENICARLHSVEVPGYQRFWERMWGHAHLHLTPMAAGCAALGAILVLLVSHAVKQPDVVALHRPPIYASMFQPPAALSSVAFLPSSPQQPGLFPGLSREESGGSPILVPAAFEGR